MRRFALVFVLLLAVYYVVAALPVFDRFLYAYLAGNARLAGLILRGLGQAVQVRELTIRSAGYAISLRRGCDAVEPAWFFCAGVLAFPVPWRRKPLVLAFGTAALLALNLARIVSLYFVGRLWPALYAPAHLEVWPAAFMLCVVALWLAWLRRTGSAPGGRGDAQA